MKKRKLIVGKIWRMDETYIKVKGVWCYLYRAVDKSGNTVDFLLTRTRQRMSAHSFLIKAISNNCKPIVIIIDKVVPILELSRFIINVRSLKLRFDTVNI
jgi:putative transposase